MAIGIRRPTALHGPLSAATRAGLYYARKRRLARLAGSAASVVQYMDTEKVPTEYTLELNTVTANESASSAFVPAAIPCVGRVYWEVEVVDASGGDAGITLGTDLDDYPSGGDSAYFPKGQGYGSNGNFFRNGSDLGASSLGSWSDGDILMFAFNSTTGVMHVGKNGTWSANPNSAPNSGNMAVIDRDAAHYAFVGPFTTDCSMTMRFTEAEFTYDIPTDYESLFDGQDDINGTEAGAGTDPYYASVVFLMGFDGTDATTPSPEESLEAIPLTYKNSAQIDTAQTPAGGASTASLLCAHSDSFVSFDDDLFDIIKGDFTIEAFTRHTQFFQGDCIFGNRHTTPSGSWGLMCTGGTPRWVVEDVINISGGTLSLNTDYHIAICRSGTTTRLFLDGAIVATDTRTHPYCINAYKAGTGIGVGGSPTLGDNDVVQGWLDEVRVTRAARYTADFSASLPSGKFPRG